MLERIHVENYKCLRDVTVDLGDFTILIGPNDSGKSSFLEVIESLGKIARQEYPSIFGGDRSLANLVWRKDPQRYIVWEATGTTSEGTFLYHVELPVDRRPPREKLSWNGNDLFYTEGTSTGGETEPGGNSPPGTPVVVFPTGKGKQVNPAQFGRTWLQQFVRQNQSPYLGIANALTSSIEYHFEPKKIPTASVPQPGISLTPSGDNLAAVLDVLQNSPDRSAFEAIQKSLHEAIPTLRGIVLPPSTKQAGAKNLEFILSGNGQAPVTIPGSLASGGVLLLTAFLTLAHTGSPGLLLFEEPENGLHPTRLQMVIEILRKMSRGELGNRKRQIIITTHNPLLLNYAKPEDVRVFVRHPEEGTQVVPMMQIPDIDRLLKEFALGELWYLLGEEKMFQEQPA